jgi:hypothetical protein
MEARASAPESLSSALWTANVLAQGNDASGDIPKRGCVNRARLDVKLLTR